MGLLLTEERVKGFEASISVAENTAEASLSWIGAGVGRSGNAVAEWEEFTRCNGDGEVDFLYWCGELVGSVGLHAIGSAFGGKQPTCCVGVLAA